MMQMIVILLNLFAAFILFKTKGMEIPAFIMLFAAIVNIINLNLNN